MKKITAAPFCGTAVSNTVFSTIRSPRMIAAGSHYVIKGNQTVYALILFSILHAYHLDCTFPG